MLLRLFGIRRPTGPPSPLQHVRQQFIDGVIELHEFECALEYMMREPERAVSTYTTHLLESQLYRQPTCTPRHSGSGVLGGGESDEQY